MESERMKSLSGQLKALVEANKDFPQKLKQRLVCESSKVENPFKLIVELFNEGVLCDGSNDLDAHCGFKEILFTLAVTIGCSKGTDGIGGLVKALESSGNLELLSALQIWAKEDLGIERDDDGRSSEAEAGNSTVRSPPRQKRRRNGTSPTELSLANLPRFNTTGLFAATSTGLVFLDLQTFEATALTSDPSFSVAVNHKLNKVYWSEGEFDARVVRSNFDGSSKEIIVLQTGKSIWMLGIDEKSGNVYFAPFGSHEITVCNALGKNCAPVISNSSLVNSPVSITLDSNKGVMYWVNSGSVPNSVVCANVDGSNATIISSEFFDLGGIALDEQHSNGLLYWADFGECTIGAIDVTDGKMRTLVELEADQRPNGIQVDARKIYFSRWWGTTIHSIDRDTGKELKTIFNCTGKVRHLAMLNVHVQS